MRIHRSITIQKHRVRGKKEENNCSNNGHFSENLKGIILVNRDLSLQWISVNLLTNKN